MGCPTLPVGIKNDPYSTGVGEPFLQTAASLKPQDSIMYFGWVLSDYFSGVSCTGIKELMIYMVGSLVFHACSSEKMSQPVPEGTGLCCVGVPCALTAFLSPALGDL